MSDDSAAVIKITGDPADFKKAAEQIKAIFGDLSDSGKKDISLMDLAFGEFVGHLMEKGLEEAVNLIGEAFEKLVDFIKESVSASAEFETSVTRLSTSLAVSGKFTEAAVKNFEDFADTMQDQTHISKNLILQNAALIESFGNLDEQGLERVTKASLDFAAATGKDAATAANLLARASEGQVEALKRAGIVIESTGDNAKDFANALGQIETKFGGAAAALSNTFVGSLSGVKQSFEELQVSLGDFITKNPAVISAIKGLGDFFKSLREDLAENKEAVNDFVNGGLGFLIDSIRPVAGTLNILLDTITALSIGFKRVEQTVIEGVEAYYKFNAAIDGAVISVEKLLGISNEKLEMDKKTSENQAKYVQDTVDGIDTEIEAEKTGAEKRSQLIDDYAKKLQDSIKGRIEDEKESQNEITEVTLVGISNRRQAADAAAAEETARRQERIASIIAETRDIEGKQAADDLAYELKKLEGEKKYVEQAKKLNDQHVKNQKDDITVVQNYENLSQKEKISNLTSTLGVIAGLQNDASGAMFEVGKAAAIAQATISGYQAVQLALASPPGPPWSFGLAALVGIQTAENVAKISGTSPPTGAADGALVTGGNGPTADDQHYMLSKGEIVAPAKSFDEVVTGVAQQRGYKTDDDSDDQTVSLLQQILARLPGNTVQVTVDYNKLDDDVYINNLVKAIREATDYRGARVS